MRTRAELAKMVPARGTMVELGVARGDFALALMDVNPSAEYVGIDRYADHHNEREHGIARSRIEAKGGVLLRATFAEALDCFPDGSIDLVYVDGYAHTGQEGGQTLRDWLRKVRPGGIMAGHDYHPKWQPTVDAVNAFVWENALTLNLIDERPYPSWWVGVNTQADL